MKDIRISIRLSEEEHTRLKIIAAKKKQSMQMAGFTTQKMTKSIPSLHL